MTRMTTASLDRMAAKMPVLTVETTGELLQGSGQVHLQMSQQGGISPVLRGFEANRVLLVVDGVRMNNAIYRSGHLPKCGFRGSVCRVPNPGDHGAQQCAVRKRRLGRGGAFRDAPAGFSPAVSRWKERSWAKAPPSTGGGPATAM